MALQPNPQLSSLATQAKDELSQTFGVEATLIACAPGRVNLIGEHIDYCDGFVLPFAIERYILIAAAPNTSRVARFSSADFPSFEIKLDEPITKAEPSWGNYIRGVLHGFAELGFQLPGFDASVVTSLPSGAGLSSSAALECATATLVEGLVDTVLPSKDKALLCQMAEHDFADVPCGIMDQFASIYGQKDRLVLIDCRSKELQLVPFHHPELTVLIANTMAKHSLSDGAYAKRRQETATALSLLGEESWRDVKSADVVTHREKLGHPLNLRALHIVSETQRTLDVAAALRDRNIRAIGPLMAGSHDSLRDNFEVSCSELDTMVELARNIGIDGGVYGTRMTGGGFGGSTVSICEQSRAPEIAEHLSKKYQDATGLRPELFVSRPGIGAHLITW